MDNVSDEFSKTELYRVAKLLEVTVVSKATKPMLVSAINKKIADMNEDYLQPVINPLGDNSMEPETVDAVKVPVKVEEKLHKGFHPITGEAV